MDGAHLTPETKFYGLKEYMSLNDSDTMLENLWAILCCFHGFNLFGFAYQVPLSDAEEVIA